MCFPLITSLKTTLSLQQPDFENKINQQQKIFKEKCFTLCLPWIHHTNNSIKHDMSHYVLLMTQWGSGKGLYALQSVTVTTQLSHIFTEQIQTVTTEQKAPFPSLRLHFRQLTPQSSMLNITLLFPSYPSHFVYLHFMSLSTRLKSEMWLQLNIYC